MEVVGFRSIRSCVLVPSPRKEVGRHRTRMPYALIALAASIALAVVYVVVTDASSWSKALVVGLLVVSLLWRYGLFLQVALGISLSLYFTDLKSRR